MREQFDLQVEKHYLCPGDYNHEFLRKLAKKIFLKGINLILKLHCINGEKNARFELYQAHGFYCDKGSDYNYILKILFNNYYPSETAYINLNKVADSIEQRLNKLW